MKTQMFFILLLCLALLNSSFTQAGAGADPILEPEVGWSAPSSAGSTASLPPLQNINAITVGKNHTCALSSGGKVECWGDNGYGQLGDGTTADRSIPMGVSSLESGVTAIAGGWYHTCALAASGGVKCWGENYHGQLGDGTTTERSMPVDVIDLGSGVVDIAAGAFHTCALTVSGGVKCWGINVGGLLGDGTLISRSTPVDVGGLASGVAAIAAGEAHNCALITGGGVKCWGSNGSGQLGDGTTTDRSAPVTVLGLGSGGASVAAGGEFSCALTTGSGVKCWGENLYGQLGNGTTSMSSVPVPVSGLENGTQAVSVGENHACALITGDEVLCWGNNQLGQLGDGTVVTRNTPAAVSGLEIAVSAVATGGNHTCALTIEGGMKCWGDNGYGQLGDGTMRTRKTPVDVTGTGSGTAIISAGGYHTCTLTTEGGVKCWGDNLNGQLGDGTFLNRSTPVDVSGLGSGITSIDTGSAHTCALTTGGGVKCWGGNAGGLLGDGTITSRNTPVDVNELGSGVATIAAGGGHNCALMTVGGVKCWGSNWAGQLGDGTTTNSSTPVNVSELESGVAAIVAGGYHACALTTGGGVKCWGYNPYGQLGDGTTTARSTPVNVSGLESGVTSLTAGTYHTCALTTGGGILCWGDNQFGQLGDGTLTGHETPVAVSGLGSGIVAISAGGYHTCALTMGGAVQCWGDNQVGQLGDGTLTGHETPVAVSGLGSGIMAISAGDYHSCGLTVDGEVKCWGYNRYGELGDGVNVWSTMPVEVVTLRKFFIPLVIRE